VLGKLARQHDPNVLVGFDHADDAGVYQVGPATALVQTVDFFTPIVDDPYTFGQIAATNALSDIYAMGGRPLTALALVCFPEKGDLEILERILAGGLSKMMDANCTIVGGHSIRDDETKFGYSVTGLIHPSKVLTNSGAKAGDRLLLTKALGTGVISTAIKKGVAKQSWIDAAVRSMTTLNKSAAELITSRLEDPARAHTPEQSPTPTSALAETAHVGTARVGTGVAPVHAERSSAIHAMTDITGFGLIGHAREVALASNVSLYIHAAQIPLLDGALECVRAGHIPGGLKANREFAECVVAYDNGISEDVKTLLFDPQTAGGLLVSVAAGAADELSKAAAKSNVSAIDIGEVRPASKPLITLVP
jgi:selenide,water dikinase